MKKCKLLIFLILFLMATACTTYKSYTYGINNGEKIEVKLKTNNNYKLEKVVKKEKSNFKILKADSVLSQGMFIDNETYELYSENVRRDSKAIIKEEKTKEDIAYIYYTYENKEFNYIIKINDADTAIILGNNVSESSAKEVFNRLSFSKK